MNQVVSLAGRDWRVARGFNLYVDISSACNASCPFCIAPTAGRKDGPGFFEGVKFALDLAASIDGTIQVVGGEPLISRRLPTLLEEIALRDYRRTVVNTNGSRISGEIVSAMQSAAVAHVNISRHHYDERCNQEIMRIRPELPNTTIASGIARIVDAGMGVRMQCNIIKDYVDSVPKMLHYIDWCAGLGCGDISFSQVFPLSLFEHQIPIEAGYAEKVQIDLRQLVSEIDTCGEFMSTSGESLGRDDMSSWGSSAWGSPHHISHHIGGKRRFWSGPRGTNVSLKTLSGYDETNLPRETAYDKQDDWELQDGLLAFAVLHPDGRVTASWDCKERLLFEPMQKMQVVRRRSSAVPHEVALAA